ncbi:spermidine/putrescine ABC transporter ATP-binding protein [Trinickia symbiotica]|uniref:Spermidine/putrescine import ATP-binding protein PotA n=1 Tax=Trinickia symbiotica TaxID=863227 RepID=A0A2T3XR94_9BURK|nr:spermidine/putrescine ABC transporter ATP-binding protein [Trinickia symbiotica]
MLQAADEKYLVRYQNIAKSYDGRNFAIENFDLDILPGEFLTMLGPSGSGKTTLLMMLAGFESPSVGRIQVRGRPIHETPPYRRNIGMVFQNYALFPHMTVAENIAYPLKVRRVQRSDIQERVKQALDMVQLGAFSQRRPVQLSGGQQQRVALARALVFNPEIVLMDEPLGALDKMLRDEMQYEIKRLHTKVGVTIVYVTHDQSEAMVMSDRVAVLNNGALQQLAPPKVLYEQPSNAFVAGFIGENNRINGTLKAFEGNYCVVEFGNDRTLKCRRGDVSVTGQLSTVTIRPEQIHVTSVGGAPEDDNCFQAIVAEVTYLGDYSRFQMRLVGGGEILVKHSNARRFTAFQPGESVSVSWSRDEACAFQRHS